MQVISNDAQLDVQVKANLSYIPVFRQISTENNAAYGEAVNHADRKYRLHESIIAPHSRGSNTQSSYSYLEQSEENYEIVD